MSLTLKHFDYSLPPKLIAQTPASPRDSSRLLVVNRFRRSLHHHYFRDLAHLLQPDDVLVINETKVIPARLIARKPTGGRVELLLLSQRETNLWTAICRPGINSGTQLQLPHNLQAEIVSRDETGIILIKFPLNPEQMYHYLWESGSTPLPPYITPAFTESELRLHYQTVYAKNLGSAAAPTAGLHFTPELLNLLKAKGIQIESLTLEVGLGTFQRLRSQAISVNHLHTEKYYIPHTVASRLMQAKTAGKRIIAVGTTTTRALESAYQNHHLCSGHQATSLFVYPPYQFQFIDSLITNFHLPQSSLLMLVAAFTTSPQTPTPFTSFSASLLGTAYRQAIKSGYRFFSFGDAMWLI